MPVSPIAISIGKKKTKTGVNSVPNPNPEKKVRIDAKNATMDMRRISKNIIFVRSFRKM